MYTFLPKVLFVYFWDKKTVHQLGDEHFLLIRIVSTMEKRAAF